MRAKANCFVRVFVTPANRYPLRIFLTIHFNLRWNVSWIWNYIVDVVPRCSNKVYTPNLNLTYTLNRSKGTRAKKWKLIFRYFQITPLKLQHKFFFFYAPVLLDYLKVAHIGTSIVCNPGKDDISVFTIGGRL